MLYLIWRINGLKYCGSVVSNWLIAKNLGKICLSLLEVLFFGNLTHLKKSSLLLIPFSEFWKHLVKGLLAFFALEILEFLSPRYFLFYFFWLLFFLFFLLFLFSFLFLASFASTTPGCTVNIMRHVDVFFRILLTFFHHFQKLSMTPSLSPCRTFPLFFHQQFQFSIICILVCFLRSSWRLWYLFLWSFSSMFFSSFRFRFLVFIIWFRRLRAQFNWLLKCSRIILLSLCIFILITLQERLKAAVWRDSFIFVI